MGKHHRKRSFPFGPFVAISTAAVFLGPPILAYPVDTNRPDSQPAVRSTGQPLIVAPGAAGTWASPRVSAPHSAPVRVHRSRSVVVPSAIERDHPSPPRPRVSAPAKAVAPLPPVAVVAPPPTASPSPTPKHAKAWPTRTGCESW